MSLFKTAEELLRRAQRESEYFATYDYLTGAFNRRAFIDHLEKEMQRSKRENTSLNLILLDVDYFKNINDTLGQACGDEILKSVVVHLVENFVLMIHWEDMAVTSSSSAFLLLRLKKLPRFRKGFECISRNQKWLMEKKRFL